MYAVIFKATTAQLDPDYDDMVAQLRALAFDKYRCQGFVAVAQDSTEIAISYWKSEQDIQNWYSDAKHSLAQKLGRDKWYRYYVVEVAEIKRSYSFTNENQ